MQVGISLRIGEVAVEVKVIVAIGMDGSGFLQNVLISLL
jgi:hypothetical protein